MLYDSDRVFRIFLGGIQSRFCFRSAPAVKPIWSEPVVTRMFLPDQVGITTRREQDYISLTDMVQRQH